MVAQARAYLDQRLDRGVPAPAIVLDVDDTSLLTHPLTSSPDPDEAETAAAQARLPAIGPTRDLARHAAQRGVGVFFVTARADDPGLRHATLVNLRGQGYPDPAGLVMRPAADHGSSVERYKSGARADVERQGYRVLESLGDQYSDLDGGHAERGFKIPDPACPTP
ncbi:hypothetical protein GCM10025787_01110 [Saccharopolyspora rosea]